MIAVCLAFVVVRWRQSGLTGQAAFAGIISGTVFQDYNANGVRDLSRVIPNAGGSAAGSIGVAIDQGVAGVTVTVYGANGSVAGTAQSDANGSYSINASGNGPSRVEFTGLPTGFQPGPFGADSKSTVQFVDSGSASNVSLGLIVPREYCQNNPTLITSCYVGGLQNDPSPVIISFPYSAGTNRETGGAPFDDFDMPRPNAEARANQVGATWGLAYARSTKQLYGAAFMKKHTGYGPNGTGAIYKIDRANPGAVSLYTDLNAIFGANTAGPNAHDPVDFDRDNGNVGWDGVGKTGLGQMAISDDEKKLYVMNLADRSLYELPLDSTPSTSTVRRRPAPANLPGCPSAGDARPFSVVYENNQLYVGLVCSAESTITATAPDGDPSKLQAYVYTVNPSSLDFSAAPIFQAALNYPRRCTDSAQLGPANCFSAKWRVWSPVYRNLGTDGRGIYPQPQLTDIAFDRGNLILAFRDRAGDQFGVETLDNPADSLRYYGVTAGDTLRACGSQATGWTLESNGRCGGGGTAPQNTGEGPGNGEYYFRDESIPFTDESFMGGMLQIPGFPDLAVNLLDPVPFNDPATLFDGGTRWSNNKTGALTKNYRVYNGERTFVGPFGKANGLSDLAVVCDSAPIEIGNRIWQDTDGDGIQDADEIAIGNVVVTLFKNGVQVGSATTNGRGEFYFNSSNVQGGLLTNMAYEIRVDKSQQVLSGFALTKAKADSSPNGGSRDSDATMVGGSAVIVLTTGGAGESDHTDDIGFIPPGGAVTITCPPNIVVTSTSGPTVVNYPPPTATGQGVSVTCTPPSGSTFPVGSTTVNCRASNAAGVVTCSFTVTVQPPPPLTITCPPDQTITVTNPAGGPFVYPLITSSDPNASIVCVPPSGAAFPPGVSTITCTATNAAGSASCSFKLTVNAPPAIFCSPDRTVISPTATAVGYVPPIVNGIGVSVSCAPPSGSIFPLGMTTVTCTATNATASVSCSFKVTVTPTPPPTINCPAGIDATATSASGAVVNYPTPTAGAGATVTCTPPSGSTFPVGSSTVTCTATNTAGSASCSFKINVTQMMKSLKCDTICFHGPGRYLLGIDHLPPGTVIIAGYNLNKPVSTHNTEIIAYALRGNTSGFNLGPLTAVARFNQQFVAAQLSFNMAGGPGSAIQYNVLWSMLSCYQINFAPVTLSNGAVISQSSMLSDLFEQSYAAIREARTADLAKLADLWDLFNSNTLLGGPFK